MSGFIAANRHVGPVVNRAEVASDPGIVTVRERAANPNWPWATCINLRTGEARVTAEYVVG